MIKPEKIKDVIGKGGDTITNIILKSSNVESVQDPNAVKIDVEENGQVVIYHIDKEVIDKAAKMIKDIVREVETGKQYIGKVVKVEDYGAYVELWSGCQGLVHVSQIAYEHVDKASDVLKVGDEIMVESLGYDNHGRLNLSRKACLPKPVKKESKKEEEASK